jgi:nicotinate-nucleotide pyrophosphorylase (carboxylating)
MKRGLTIAEIVADARMASSHLLKVEIEVTDAAMALLAISAGADVILLDNMTPEQMRQVVVDAPDGVLFEASGGVNEQTIREVAATGVHLVSVGALTHSAPALDISLEIEAQ